MRPLVPARSPALPRSLVAAPALLTAAVAVHASDPAGTDFFSEWFSISDAAKESQPHWITPLFTVTPRLEQEYRYDQFWQNRAGGVQLDNFGNGKGLEVIPLPNTEFILGQPAYQVRHTPKGDVSGWLDETVLLKYRLLSQNEEHGNYIVTGFLGYSFPTGNLTFTNGKGIVTPTLAGGKGWGTRAAGFDIVSTVGVAIPVADEKAIGTTVTWNTTVQAHCGKLWPELETSFTSYHDGPRDGKSQLALTAGVIAGRFELSQRVRLILGAGFQWTASNYTIYKNEWLGTVRITF